MISVPIRAGQPHSTGPGHRLPVRSTTPTGGPLVAGISLDLHVQGAFTPRSVDVPATAGTGMR